MRYAFVLFYVLYAAFVFSGCSHKIDIPDVGRSEINSSANEPQRANALSLTILSEKIVFNPTDTVTIRIENPLPVEINTGYEYSIYQFSNETWVKIPLEILVEDIELAIFPNESFEMEVSLFPEQFDYTAGMYRIEQAIWVDGAKQMLFADFEMEL